ncbi:S8 family serine peptidase [uncultured Turicimonas sp.]|uniref:S8 family serine peptidase n=1 Tax=uncultured Turicimonas sp. TaxID=1918607 RepID=UPI0032119D00
MQKKNKKKEVSIFRSKPHSVKFFFLHKKSPLLKRQVLALFSALFVPLAALAATEQDFKTPEYYASNGLDLINAAPAYAQGFTGKGVLIGLLDTEMQSYHPELSEKFEVVQAFDKDGNRLPLPTVWDVSVSHGTHVASIMAAKKDDNGMHGVAFDSNVVGQVYIGLQEFYYPDNENFFQKHPEIKILNNSWTSPELNKDQLPTGELYSINEAKKLSKLMGERPHSGSLVNWALNNPNSLAVIAAANDGWVHPSFTGMLPRYYGSELGNWITVVSANPLDTRRENGKIVFGPTGLSLFSNVARGAELFSITAPGSNILAANVIDGKYVLKSGTSMAAPQVSGAAALVAQAFPWMTGKQLADTLLTTANSNIECPDILVGFDNSVASVLVFYYFSNDRPSQEQLIQAITKTYQADPAAWPTYSLNTLIDLFVKDHYEKDGTEKFDDKYVRLVKVTKEEVFGQGMLDVGKAVNGIARLDVNRMKAEDIRSYAEFGNEKFAFERFNTQGKTAFFNNDISESLWNDKYHHEEYKEGVYRAATTFTGLKPGLIKEGSGVLVLTGTNTYSAPTVVEGGVLDISKRADGSGGTLVHSSILVQNEGALLGNGTVNNKVINHGTFIPGDFVAPFTVGHYVQSPSGNLIFFVSNGGEHNSLKVLDEAKLEGKILLGLERGFHVNDSLHQIQLQELIEVSDPSKLSLDLEAIKFFKNSGTLDAELERKGNSIFLKILRLPDSYTQYAQTPAQFSLGNALYAVASQSSLSNGLNNLIELVDFSDPRNNEVSNILQDTLPNLYLNAQKADLEQLRTINNLLFSAQTENGYWTKVLGTRGSTANSTYLNGYRTYQYGVLGGYRTKVSDQVKSGLFIGAAQLNLKEKNSGSKYDSTRFLIGAEARYLPQKIDGLTVFGSMFVGVNDAKATRKSVGSAYKGHWTGFGFSTQAGAEFLAGSETIKAGPFALVDYSWLRTPSFTEKGSGIPQSIASHHRGNISSLIGLKFQGSTQIIQTSITSDIWLGWRHSYSTSEAKIGTKFADASPRFFAGTDSFQKDSMEGSLRVSLEQKTGVYGGLEAWGAASGKARNIGANLFIGKKF